jgi:thioredoxin-like negative regulator of GroEL
MPVNALAVRYLQTSNSDRYCTDMAPIYERVCSEFEPDVRFLKLDTESEPELAARYDIRSIPILMLFRKGNVVARQAGALDPQTLRAWLCAGTSHHSRRRFRRASRGSTRLGE